MTTVRFELLTERLTSQDEPSSYAMGHISIVGARGAINSKITEPPRSMMIFLSIVDLLDGLRRLMSNHECNEYLFVGTDTSFTILFEKVRDEVRITAGGSVIDECPSVCLASAVIEGLDLFLASTRQPDEPALSDLKHSIADFRAMLNRME